MSADENKTLVRRYYEEVVNTGDVNRLAEFISPAFVEVHNNTRHPDADERRRTKDDAGLRPGAGWVRDFRHPSFVFRQ